MLEGQPGHFLSEGVLDVAGFIDAAKQAGIYLIAVSSKAVLHVESYFSNLSCFAAAWSLHQWRDRWRRYSRMGSRCSRPTPYQHPDIRWYLWQLSECLNEVGSVKRRLCIPSTDSRICVATGITSPRSWLLGRCPTEDLSLWVCCNRDAVMHGNLYVLIKCEQSKSRMSMSSMAFLPTRSICKSMRM